MSERILGNDNFRQFLFNELLATLGHDWYKIQHDYCPGVAYEEVKEELKELFAQPALPFWTVNTKTKAGVEGRVFTFAKSAVEAQEKVKKHFADEYSDFLEQAGGDQAKEEYGSEPLIEVVSVILKDSFIP